MKNVTCRIEYWEDGGYTLLFLFNHKGVNWQLAPVSAELEYIHSPEQAREMAKAYAIEFGITIKDFEIEKGGA